MICFCRKRLAFAVSDCFCRDWLAFAVRYPSPGSLNFTSNPIYYKTFFRLKTISSRWSQSKKRIGGIVVEAATNASATKCSSSLRRVLGWRHSNQASGTKCAVLKQFLWTLTTRRKVKIRAKWKVGLSTGWFFTAFAWRRQAHATASRKFVASTKPFRMEYNWQTEHCMRGWVFLIPLQQDEQTSPLTAGPGLVEISLHNRSTLTRGSKLADTARSKVEIASVC